MSYIQNSLTCLSRRTAVLVHRILQRCRVNMFPTLLSICSNCIILCTLLVDQRRVGEKELHYVEHILTKMFMM